MAKKKDSPGSELKDFESSTEQLDSITKILEADTTSLEQALEVFREGIVLIRRLQTTLQTAEQQVSSLLNDQDSLTSTGIDQVESKR